MFWMVFRTLFEIKTLNPPPLGAKLIDPGAKLLETDRQIGNINTSGEEMRM